MANRKGFEPLACSLGGCRHIQARPPVRWTPLYLNYIKSLLQALCDCLQIDVVQAVCGFCVTHESNRIHPSNKQNLVIFETNVNYIMNVIIYSKTHVEYGDALCSLVAKRGL